nr:helix-turn-helix transcriptional regulator [Alicyclobacillus kakegawensis]
MKDSFFRCGGDCAVTQIELIRRMKGLSQTEVAARLGVSATIVSHTEKRYRRPYPKFRRALADLYGLPESMLFSPDGWPLEVELSGFAKAE